MSVNFANYKAPLNTKAYFQNGISGYNGTQDTWINQANSTANYGNSEQLQVDTDVNDAPTSNLAAQTLLKFDNIFGLSPSQIPIGAKIKQATLKLTLSNQTSTVNPNFSIYSLNVPWDEATTTWDSLGNGLSAINDYNNLIKASFSGQNNVDLANNFDDVRYVDITSAVQSWANNPNLNYGLGIISENNNDRGISLFSSEASEIMYRPTLTVEYELPI